MLKPTDRQTGHCNREKWTTNQLVLDSHAGSDFPFGDRRSKLKNSSCGVAFVLVHGSDRIECNASGNTACHESTGKLCDFNTSLNCFP